MTSSHHGCAQRGLALQPLLPHCFRTAIQVLLSGYETRVGAPRRSQSRTSSGRNLLPRTPNRCETSSPRRYARRTVSSWQPTYSETSNAVIKRLGSPVFADAVSAGACVASAVCADSVYVVFLIGTPPHSCGRRMCDAEC